MFKIVADHNIPDLTRQLAGVGDVALVQGEEITSGCLAGATILLVRSVTRVDRELLEGTSVRFVGSATAGIDHIDTGYLSDRQIAFAYAPGSNAPSVVDYVVAALVRLAVRRALSLRSLTVGIVGFGQVGSRLAARLHNAGIQTLVNDPPLEMTDPHFAGDLEVRPLRHLLEESDVVSLHVPLSLEGPHRTSQLIGGQELALLRHDAILINTSRGAVVDGGALRTRLESGWVGNAVLDVYEGEPRPDRRLIALADIATPHIAGYALDSKLVGTRMLVREVRSFLGLKRNVDVESERDAPMPLDMPSKAASHEEWADQLIRQMYDVESDSAALKHAAAEDKDLASSFQRLRRQYPERRTFDRYYLEFAGVPAEYRPIASALGILMVPTTA